MLGILSEYRKQREIGGECDENLPRILKEREREKRLNESLGWEVLVFAIKGIKESVAGFGKKKKVKVLLGFPWVSSFA